MATVVVVQFPGVNCEYESARVLESVGLDARIVRWNDASSAIRDAAAILIPGGFSYQDRIRAGVVAAKDSVMDDVVEAAAKGKPVIGICNGAQILVEAGAVPGVDDAAIDLVLGPNKMPDRSGYLCRWSYLKKGPANCVFTEFMGDEALPIPMAHGEGRFVTSSESTANRLEAGDGVALTYVESDGSPAAAFPDNPNGSMFAIAGVTNPDGNVLAVMPHPERGAWMHQVPRYVGGAWGERRNSLTTGDLHAAGPGRGFFESLKKALAQ